LYLRYLRIILIAEFCCNWFLNKQVCTA